MIRRSLTPLTGTRIGRRTVIAMVVGVMLPALSLLVIGYPIVSSEVMRGQAAIAEAAFQEVGDLGCEREGADRFFRRAGNNDIYAYDGESLRSANPNAPALPDELQHKLRRGTTSSARFLPVVGGYVAARVHPTGPCSVLVFTWAPRRPFLGIIGLVLSLGVASALSAGLGLAWIVWPLVARLAHLAAIAKHVGKGIDEMSSVKRSSADEITDVESVLRDADRRIRADARALADKNTAMERFLVEIGHDMKVPFAALSLAVDELSTQRPPEEAVRTAAAELAYLEQLVENLRLEARFAQGLVAAETVDFDLSEVVERVCRRIQLVGHRAGVDLQYAIPDRAVTARGDPSLVERAVANLVHNAVVHGALHAAVLLEQVGSLGFLLRISDDGPGVDENILPQLGRSPMTASLSTGRRGEGLGLSIARRIVEGAGWQLVFLNDEETGGLTAQVASSP